VTDLTITDFVGAAWWFIGGAILLGSIVQTVQQRRARVKGERSRAVSDRATGAVLGSAAGYDEVFYDEGVEGIRLLTAEEITEDGSLIVRAMHWYNSTEYAQGLAEMGYGEEDE
jgi:hypothetical protein